ncbi:hypothetical protein [Streptomyces sp. NPDC056468]|uniref:hypothetical protein n=1 Tax=Streptomyces sp. NPDC056468 TaxID=3345830 RepID=UPI0036C691A1
MDDIAQDPTSSSPAQRVARGRAIWDRYNTQYGQYAAVDDVIADLLHFADADVTGGAGTVLRRAQAHYSAERPDGLPQHPAPDAEPPLFDEHGNYTPSPGTEYPFAISDIARATAKLLGQGWTAESGYWGVTGALAGPYTAEFEFVVDYQGDLILTYTPYEADGFPDSPELPDGVKECGEGVYRDLASAADGLDNLAERAAAAIRAVTGYNPDDFDFESSASRQHHIDTGRYLRKGEVEQA